MTICAHCESTFRAVDGEVLELSPEVRDCAQCDGELVGLAPSPVESPHVGHAPGANSTGTEAWPWVNGTPCSATSLGQNPSPLARPASLAGASAATNAPPHVGRAAAPLEAALRSLIKNDGLGAVYRAASRALGFTLQTVSPPLRRACLARDHHRCTVPGCQNQLFIDLHHLKKVRDGGAHTFENLTTLCSAHHRQHHAGYLGIEGTPSTGLVFRTARGTLYGERPKCAAA